MFLTSWFRAILHCWRCSLLDCTCQCEVGWELIRLGQLAAKNSGFLPSAKIRTHQYLRPSSLHRSPGASSMRTMILNIYWMNPCTSLVSKSRAYTNTSVSSLEYWILSSPWLRFPQLHLYSLAKFLRWAAASEGWSSPLHSPPVRQVLPWRSYYYSYFHSARVSLPPR